MRAFLLTGALAMAFAGSAHAQLAPGSIGNAGRMPETMSPGALPPPLPITPPVAPTPPATSYGGRYPDTQSLSRDRIQADGYRVQRMTRQNEGSWKADVTRDAVPTRPQGVPSKVTIFPDGRIVEERQP
ncbi:MAG: hypothetical protein FJX11_14830 [Alphaproteobacteria bacterium]|nr:hypothetical protein [Alphaproteobacteria bacterium]